MDKNGLLTLANWQNGQAESPYLGFDTIRNIDAFTTPGVAKVTYRLNLLTTTTGIPVAHVEDNSGNIWDLIRDKGNGNGQLYKNGVVYSDLAGVGWDMIVYKEYLIIRSGTTLTTIAINGSTAFFQNWTPTGFVALSATQYGKMIVSRNDGFLYIANGANIKRISGFTASASFAVPPTATMDTAIVLPDGLYVTTMGELGSHLMCGTQTATLWAVRYASQKAVILPYRIGVSAVNFDNPVTITDANCVQQIIVSNNLMYITAGMKGNVYVSDGTSYRKIARLPYFTKDEYGMGILYYPNAMTVGTNGNLLIGTTSFFNGYYGNGAQHGLYEINLFDPKYPVVLKNVISTGSFDGTQTIAIGYIFQAVGDVLKIGWQDGNSYGFDITDGLKYTNYGAVIETQIYFVGRKLEPKDFQQIEITFGQPLTLNQGIRVSYRKDSVSDYIPIGTWTFATQGATVSINDKALISKAELLQLKIEMTTNISPGATPYENIELLAIKLW